MSKKEKLIQRLLSEPKNFTWDELVTVLGYYGFNPLNTGKTGGSRRKFTDANKVIISFHKPHPSNIVKPYVIKQVIDFINDYKDDDAK